MSIELSADEAASLRLAQQIAEMIDERGQPPEVMLLALAKVAGHAVTMAPEGMAPEVLERLFARARRQMQVSLLAAQLRSAGLGSLMAGTARSV